MVISLRVALAGALCLGCFTALGQKGGSGGGPGSSSGGNSGDSGNSPGFSIETEMFTYRAVEQNSEAMACDIARYLYGGAVQDAPKDAHVPCAVNGEGQPPQGIVLISGGSTLVTDFQIWRADMAAMDSLRARAAAVCVAGTQKGEKEEHPGPGSEGAASSRGLGSTVASLMSSTAPGQMISGAGAVMGMFSSNQSVSSVVGTVQDPALMNEVARQLRALNIRVMIPELYSPSGLSSPDPSHSPYLENMNALITAYDGCLKDKGEDVSSVSDAIKQFLTVTMMAGAVPKAADAGKGAADGGGSATEKASETPLAAALAADAVARKLGITDDPAASTNKSWPNLLWVKALESGGSVTRIGNVFGTKVRFGGGAVDTFALFRMDGDLVCSGNVYSFQSPVKLKDLDKKYSEEPKRGPAESTLLRSTCSPLPSS
ncbi:MAG TPA: hypothetical protein VHU89_07335 [Acidobacteriaceae bacterium]|jgi:hypothetical protein|nr:hypothetical protein [Acidobacteriaceae bacterium]